MMTKRRSFGKREECYKALFQVNIDNLFKCYACGSVDYYLTRKNYTRICSECKAKTLVTRGTIFHNLRFGLLKAFKIMDEVEKSGYNVSSVYIAQKYRITQSTAWKFIKKIKENQNVVNDMLHKNIGRRPIRSKHSAEKENLVKLERLMKEIGLDNDFLTGYDKPSLGGH